jgi:hypothetical protein
VIISPNTVSRNISGRDNIPPASLALPLTHNTTPTTHPIELPLRQSSPVAIAYKELDTILDQYIEWLMTQCPDRSTQFLNAGQALRREFIDIDLIKDQSNKQLADLSIPVGIVGLLRRYIYNFKVWRRSSFRSQVTP